MVTRALAKVISSWNPVSQSDQRNYFHLAKDSKHSGLVLETASVNNISPSPSPAKDMYVGKTRVVTLTPAKVKHQNASRLFPPSLHRSEAPTNAGKTSWPAVGLCLVCVFSPGRPPWPTEDWGWDWGQAAAHYDPASPLSRASAGWTQLHPPALGSTLLLVLLYALDSFQQLGIIHMCVVTTQHFLNTKLHSGRPQLDHPTPCSRLLPLHISILLSTIPSNHRELSINTYSQKISMPQLDSHPSSGGLQRLTHV